MKNKHLEGCPICGDIPYVSKMKYGDYKVFCDQGDKEHICVAFGDDKEDAIKNWNNRVKSKEEMQNGR